MTNNTQALVYASFILDGTPDIDKLHAVCQAAGIAVPHCFIETFAAHLAQHSLSEVLSNLSLGGSPGSAGAQVGGEQQTQAAEAEKEEEEEEEEEEDDDDMGFGLFD